MTDVLLFPDTMFDLRAWLRAHTLLTNLSGGRVFFRIPDDISKAPFLRIYRVGGGVQYGEAPLQDIRIAIEAWGMENKHYTSVRQTVIALESLFHAADNVQLNGAGSTLLLYSQVTSVSDQPDPDTGWPRILLDVIATVRTS